MAVIISWIRSDLESQNPLMGIARMNEYLESGNPMRNALMRRVSIPEPQSSHQATIKLLAGARLKELSDQEQHFVISCGGNTAHRSRPLPTPRRRLGSIAGRRSVRQNVRWQNNR